MTIDVVLNNGGVEDDILVKQALAGSEEAFRHLVGRYQGMVLGLCHNLLGDDAEAEDAAQDAFVLFYRNLRRYRVGGKLANWLYTIALNVCRKVLRRRKIIRFFSMDSGPKDGTGGRVPQYPSDGPSVERMVEGREEVELVALYVSRLPEDLRFPVILRYYQGLDEADIAPMLGISPGNLRVRLHRARMKLWESYTKAVGIPVTAAAAGDRPDRRKDANVPN
jgi:RNA polymerase sigma-70 factor (ECF subfamily)